MAGERRALITGGAGFIGYHLARELIANGYTVDLVDDFYRGVKDAALENLVADARVNFRTIDLRHPLDVSHVKDTDYDYIYHLAAIIGVEHVLERPFDVLKDNMAMLYQVIDIARRQKHLRRFVFTSTSEVYDGTLKFFTLEMPVKEDTPLTVSDLTHPRTSYMLSKIYGEAVLNQSGLPVTIVRPFNFYGPRMGMAHVIDQKMEQMYHATPGKKITVYSPEHRRTFCYIKDAVQIMRRLAESPDGMQVFNIGTEEDGFTMRDICALIANVVGNDVRLVDGATTPGSPVRRCPSMLKVKDTVGLYTQTPLEAGLRETYRWYEENIFRGNDVCAS